MLMDTTLKFVVERKVKAPTVGTSKSAGIDFYVPEDLKPTEIYELYSKLGYQTTDVPNFYYGSDNTIFKFTIPPGKSLFIPTGVRVRIPENHILKFENKSGIASKKGLICGACVVDEDYTGIIHINLWNASKNFVDVMAGDKIIQGILYPILLPSIEKVDRADILYKDFSTDRGEGGFGSTGTK